MRDTTQQLRSTRPIEPNHLIMTPTEKARADFSARLNAVLLATRDAALRQFEYNLDTNAPAGRMDINDASTQAIRQGMVSAASSMHSWEIEPSLELAAAILEDVNAHAEAAPLFEALRRMRSE